MSTFIGIFSMVFLIIALVYAANKADNKLNNAVYTTGKMEERLNAVEMRLNALLEKIGGDDETMGR